MAIKIDAATMLSNATQLSSYKTEVDTAWTSIQTLVRGMCNTEVFDGAAASAYLAKMESYQSTMTSLSQMLEDLSTKLTTTANTFEETDTSLAGAMG